MTIRKEISKDEKISAVRSLRKIIPWVVDEIRFSTIPLTNLTTIIMDVFKEMMLRERARKNIVVCYSILFKSNDNYFEEKDNLSETEFNSICGEFSAKGYHVGITEGVDLVTARIYI